MAASLYHTFGDDANESNSEQLKLHFKEKIIELLVILASLYIFLVMKRYHMQ